VDSVKGGKEARNIGASRFGEMQKANCTSACYGRHRRSTSAGVASASHQRPGGLFTGKIGQEARVFRLYFDTDGTSLQPRDYSSAILKIVGKETGHGRRFPWESALLNQVSVLIVEDEPFIALALATAVEKARGNVIGPAGSVREALMLIERHLVQAAVLDVNLSDRDVTPIAELLIEGGVPVIFYSGLALPAALRERFPSASVFKKPTPPVQLLTRLVALMRRQSGDGVVPAEANVSGPTLSKIAHS
jgi:CheY-like chemotaxis protein